MYPELERLQPRVYELDSAPKIDVQIVAILDTEVFQTGPGPRARPADPPAVPAATCERRWQKA